MRFLISSAAVLCCAWVFFLPQCVQVALVILDKLYFLLSYLDNVDDFNNRRPNYLEGNWKPVHSELRSVEVFGVGSLPTELLGGTYARTGANLACWPPANKHHAFNGEAMLHLLHFQSDSSVKYTNSWIKEQLPHKRWDNIGAECGPSFGFADLNEGGLFLLRYMILSLKTKLLGGTMPPRERIQAGSTAIVHHAGKVFAVSELFLPFEINITRDSVTPVGFYDFDGVLTNRHPSVGPKDGTFSAHPLIDPKDGTLYFLSTNQFSGALSGDAPTVDFGVVNTSGQLNTYIQIPVSNPASAFYHDITQTENYIIFVESSLKKDQKRLSKFEKMIYYNSSDVMRFGVIPKKSLKSSEVTWIDTKRPGHIWHFISAREEDDTIVVFAPKFESYEDSVKIHLSSEAPSRLTRFELDMKSKIAEEKIISDYVVERPTTNTAVLNHKYTYLRSEGLMSREMGTELLKLDLEKEEVVAKISCSKECIFNEALFIPRTNGTSEDDGFLVDIVYFPSSHSSSLMVWDAKTFQKTPLFSANLPQRVPYGVHGIWFQNLK